MPDERLQPLPGGTCLAALIYQFQVLPTRTIHPEWAGRLLPFERKWWIGGRKELRVSNWLLQHQHLPPAFSVNHQGAALLPSDVLLRLVRIAGAVMLAPALQSLIDGRVLRTLGDTLAIDLSSLISRAAFLFRQDSLPQAWRLPDEPWMEALEREGIRRLVAATPREIYGRLRLKFHPDHQLHFEREYKADEAEASRSLIKKLLVKEVDAAWAPLFT